MGSRPESRNHTCAATGPPQGTVGPPQGWTQIEVIRLRDDPPDGGRATPQDFSDARESRGRKRTDVLKSREAHQDGGQSWGGPEGRRRRSVVVAVVLVVLVAMLLAMLVMLVTPVTVTVAMRAVCSVDPLHRKRLTHVLDT